MWVLLVDVHRAAFHHGAVRGAEAWSPTSSWYFEPQFGACRGKHALNSFLGGPYVTQDACRRRVQHAVHTLSAAGLDDAESAAHHLDSESGMLSIDVIHVLGAGALGIQVAGDAVPLADFRVTQPAASSSKCNNCN